MASTHSLTATEAASGAGRAAGAAPVLLEARGLEAGFGSNQVLHGVSLQVREGEIAGVFGLNGAGKSVTMKVLAGLLPAWSGTVTFAGDDITRLMPEQRVDRGIGNVPQGRQVFPTLTVEENLRLGAYTSRRRDRSRYPERLARVLDQFPLLADRRHQLAGSLSGGQQASLAVARALINQPRLLLIDEPSAGLAPVIVRELFEVLQGVRETGVTMLLVEQNVSFGLAVADRAHILQTGQVVFEGDVAELDQPTLARHLGIGRMLSATTGQALEERAAASKKAPAKKRTSRTRTAKKRAPAKEKARAKKRAVKKRAPAKKRAVKKRAPAKKRAAAKTKKAPAKKRAARKKKSAAKKRAPKRRST